MALLLGPGSGIALADTPTPTPSSTPSASSTSVGSSWIRLDSLTPATVPTQGNIVLTGTVYNGSNATWHDLSVLPATSTKPLTSTEMVSYYATYDPELVHLGGPMGPLSATLPDLKPGGTTHFRISIPRASLPINGETGAYWLGVTPMTDGQPIGPSLTARTYFPLLPKANKKAHLDVSLVVPLRGEPLRATNGQVADPASFTSLLSNQGRLGRIVEFAQAAGSRPLTWLVDPALLDLADQTVNGVSDYGVNTVDASSTPTPSPSPSGSTSPSPSATPTASSNHAGPDVTSDQAITIRGWSSTIKSLLSPATTYALPYGDPAVGTLVSSGNSTLMRQAIDDSRQSLALRGITSPKIAVAPSTGTLSQDAWNALTPGQTAFVNGATSTTGVTSQVWDERTLIVASPASDGGPGPSDSTSAFNVRQRLLAEASVSIGSAKTTALTVVLPSTWDPGSSADIGSFFRPLTRRWVSFTALPAAPAAVQNPTMSHARTSLTGDQQNAINAALQLEGSASRLSSLLSPDYDKTTLLRQISATALSTLSSDTASRSRTYLANTIRTAESLDNLMDAVRVEGTQFVTLSGSSGVITVAIHNGLNLPITVGLHQIDQPYDSTVSVNSINPTHFDPGERTTVRLTVNAPRVSVQRVTLSAVNAAGSPVGTPLVFTLRSSPVGAVVWAVTIAIVLVIVLFTGRRMRRRWVARRMT